MQNLNKASIVFLFVGVVLVNITTGYAQTLNPSENPSKLYLPVVMRDATNLNIGEIIPGQYLVTLKTDMVTSSSVSAIATEFASRFGATVFDTYDTGGFKGFAFGLPTKIITDALAALVSDPQIDSIEQDRVWGVSEINTPATMDTVDTVQPTASWGLDRIDQRYLPLDGQYNYGNGGATVRVYILDTGIRITHNEFQNRATYGFDAIDGSLPADDCHGHGTRVASIVGGKTYGVAKQAQLIAVRAFGCNGGGSGKTVTAGITWLTNQHRLNPTIPMVVNMSFTLAPDPSSDVIMVEKALKDSILSGITYVIAAGNDGLNTCNVSPGRVPEAITVGATTSFDVEWYLSNYGGCIDLFAPGVDISVADNVSDSSSTKGSGTSFAAPFVTGAVAIYLQRNPQTTPSQVASVIVSQATSNAITTPGNGSPNRLLFIPHMKWFLRNTNTAGSADLTFNYGTPSNTPIVGDWDGNGTSTVGVFRPGNNQWELRNSNDGGYGQIVFTYGAAGDIPVVGDWDGNKTDTIGVFRPSTNQWLLRNSNSMGNPDIIFTFDGNSGCIPNQCIPFVGDWNGDGKDTIGVFNIRGGARWLLRNSNSAGNADLNFIFTGSQVTPIVGDWNGDGKDTIGAYDRSLQAWYLRNSNSTGQLDISFYYGLQNSEPLVGDWNGDGKDTPAVILRYK